MRSSTIEQNYALIALFAALIAALGLIPKFTLVSGVPITAQSLGIMLCGTVLGARRGTLAVLLFLLLVALGLPILAGGRGGLGLFLSPSAGFLVGFPLAAFAAGFMMERVVLLPIMVRATISALCGGILIMYIPGIMGMALTLNKSVQEAALLALPFLPGDILKAAIAGLLTSSIARFRPQILKAST